ncbi:DUF305 domain-containing protein [Catenuloplanes atrovinosus]|uniref:Uncharacterized protein (DUF305 family) n=1 Tax=Catenuloplanes atrovinosus TaxID=137266 RepID=A0AAE4CGT3_9ACTN|nr:DUF305 domain-containing protein [Catenuloplanes atrovinosus]MDR7281025.1 uncharacterized protein (DUF305 family) [Catenuloplanes atrovinosus]
MSTTDISSEPSTDDGSEEPVPAPPARRFTTVWLTLAVVIGLALGYAAGFLTPFATTPGDDSVEAGFIRDMSTHHAQAVEMAMIMHTKAQDDQVASLAADIAITQQGQIGTMSAWLRDWRLDPTGSEPRMAWMPNSQGSLTNGLMPGMATPEQLDALRAATGVEAEKLFLDLMLTHHLGGIHMAEEVVDLTGNEDVDWLAGTMVASQQREIQAIQIIKSELPAG